MAKKLTYESAIAEIHQIIEQIENDEVNVDQLSEKLNRAKELFDFCQKMLKQTKDNVDNLLDLEK
jgi:exodeoxyribonuclease VII small subunit